MYIIIVWCICLTELTFAIRCIIMLYIHIGKYDDKYCKN